MAVNTLDGISLQQPPGDSRESCVQRDAWVRNRRLSASLRRVVHQHLEREKREAVWEGDHERTDAQPLPTEREDARSQWDAILALQNEHGWQGCNAALGNLSQPNTLASRLLDSMYREMCCEGEGLLDDGSK